MKSYYTEHLITQYPDGKTNGKRFLVIAGAVVLELACFVFGVIAIPFIGMLIPIGIIALAFWLFKKFDLEFEYTFFDEGDLYIDKIISQSKRKRVLATSVKEMEMVVSATSYEAQNYGTLKTIDCSSHEPNAVVYLLITSHKGERVKVLFEPNQKILEGMRYMVPRKVVL